MNIFTIIIDVNLCRGLLANQTMRHLQCLKCTTEKSNISLRNLSGHQVGEGSNLISFYCQSVIFNCSIFVTSSTINIIKHALCLGFRSGARGGRAWLVLAILNTWSHLLVLSNVDKRLII